MSLLLESDCTQIMPKGPLKRKPQVVLVINCVKDQTVDRKCYVFSEFVGLSESPLLEYRFSHQPT